MFKNRRVQSKLKNLLSHYKLTHYKLTHYKFFLLFFKFTKKNYDINLKMN